MLNETGARRERAAEAILAYLARHQGAADTEDGIAQFWLPETGGDFHPADVRHALEALVENGSVQRLVLPDGSAIYRMSSP